MRAVVLVVLLASTLGPGCVFLLGAPVPCGGNEDCPDTTRCNTGAQQCEPAADAGPQGTPLASDDFEGTAGSAWSTDWSCPGGSATNVLVNGTGRLRLDAAGRIDCSRTTANEVDLRVDVTLPAAPGGVVVVPRRQRTPHGLSELALVVVNQGVDGVEIYFVGNEDVDLQSANLTQPGSSAGVPLEGTDKTLTLPLTLSLRVRVDGPPVHLLAKLWPRDTHEPPAWTVDVTLAEQRGAAFVDGDVTALGLASTSASAVASFDNFTVYDASALRADGLAP